MKETQKTTESDKKVETLKTFRASGDIDNFYRFVHENSLRREAKMIIKFIVDRLASQKKRRAKRKVQ